MSSFIQTTEQATTDVQDISKKILSHLKTYTFFIFYEMQKEQKKNISTIQVAKNLNKKLNFSLKDDKSNSPDKNQSYTQKSKQVQLHFYDVNNQGDMLHAISDIRNLSLNLSDKAKIVINASEEKLGMIIEDFQNMKLDLSSIPIVLNSNQFQSDISVFLGWKKQQNQCLAAQSLPFYRMSSQQWIKSSSQKIDLWQIQLSVSRENGQISKLFNNKVTPVLQKSLKQYFISHFCIGYHASMLFNCKQKITTNEQSIGNSFISMMEKFKKFCCIGERNMKATTGIANISLIGENGEQLEILKQLRPGDSSQEESQTDFKANKYKQYKDVLSILLTNLNIYQNNPLQKSIQGKINDGKIQLITFDSQKSHRKICSSPGQIKIKLQAQTVDVQVGQTLYRLEKPEQIIISFAKKIKIGIHNQVVKC